MEALGDMYMNMKNKINLLLLVIILLAAIFRIYKIDQVPPSLSWDEAANGYNAYTIANYGRDEHGKYFPAYFRSFGDDKHPIHIYLTAPFVKILGLNEFSTRLPSAVFGTLNVLLIFFLTNLLFKNKFIALFTAFLLAISPYNIHFSRFNHEVNFVLFFFMLGLVLFFTALKKGGLYLPFSILSFGLCFISYHPAKIVVPVILFFLFILYFRNFLQNKKSLLRASLVAAIFLVIILVNPELLGVARVNQTLLKRDRIIQTNLYKQTGNEFFGKLDLILTQYSWHFLPEFLFIKGDANPRLSFQTGQFYKIEAVFLIAGVLFLIHKRSKEGLLLLVWALIAPIPSSLTEEAPHAARASFMMGSWHIISALGFYFILSLVRFRILKILISMITIIILTYSLKLGLDYYYGEYAERYAIEWQYGMKQIVEFVKENEEYNQIFVTDIRSQPYIFFLYYLKEPIPEYLNSVLYNNLQETKSFNMTASFRSNYRDFYFGGWDPVESAPQKDRLYVLSPSQYGGLRYREAFDVKKIIHYPNGGVAFYIVSAI